MFSILLLFGVGLTLKPLEHLKKEWKHPDWKSWEHFWNETFADDGYRPMTPVMKAVEEARIVCKLQGECPTVIPSITGARVNCVNGFAGEYPCSNIDLLSFISLADLGSSSSADGNDIWGYDAADGRRYAITGQTDGASIVDVTIPEEPEVLVWLQSQRTQNTVWRDMKVMNNYVYIVADGSGANLQYVNLDEVIARARQQDTRPLRILRDSINRNTAISNCHNIALNRESGIAYAIGANVASGGLYAFDVNAGEPRFVGQFSSDGYTHDTECITYRGPDERFSGNEICFGYNENSVTIVDVTSPSSMVMLSRTTYANSAYTHQGWINDGHTHILFNDELDESRFGFNTRTHVWDVQSLTNPIIMTYYSGPTPAIDHNLYIDGNFVFESNYRAGLRVIDISDIANLGGAGMHQVAFFDTYPANDNPSFDGAWSSYAFWDDIVVVQDINRGLFVLSKGGFSSYNKTATK